MAHQLDLQKLATFPNHKQSIVTERDEQMYLVVVNDERGALVCEKELRTELSIGRTTDNQIILQDSSVSRKHAVLYIDHDMVFIQDLGSVNGVQVDDISVQGSVQVSEQSQVKIGTFKLFIEYVSPAESDRGGFQTAVVHPNQAHGKIVVIEGPQAGKNFTCLSRSPV